jgi:transcription initiation factor TFIIE subunit beta
LSSFFIQALQNEIIYISRPIDKKKIVFYNDKTAALPVDEEFQKLWRSVAVESMDDQKIEEYLEKQVCNTCSHNITRIYILILTGN